MSIKEKGRLKVAGVIGVVLIFIAFYVGHVADACDDRPYEISTRIGIPLFVLFCGLLYSVKTGQTTTVKIVRVVAKTVFNFIFAVGLLALSFNLCF